MNELNFAQKEKIRIAEGLAWYAAAEKRVYEIMARATPKKAKKAQQPRARG
jgi:hypothetical protein